MAGKQEVTNTQLGLRRAGEMAAVFMIGDGLLGLLQPDRHVALWRSDFAAVDLLVRPFGGHPTRRRLYGAVQAAAGIFLASRLRRAMIAATPIGLPSLVTFYVGMAVFIAAMLAARRRGRQDGAVGGTRSRRSMLGIVVEGLGFVAVGLGPVRVALAPSSPDAVIAALVVGALMAVAVVMFAWATRTMGRNWSVVARTLDDHRLVQDGPFAYVRHPIYLALFLMLVALSLAYGHHRQLLVGVPLYVIGTWLRVVEEERLLRSMFGLAYDGYAARVRRFLPGIV